MDRRDFLKTTVLGAGVAALGCTQPGADEAAPKPSAIEPRPRPAGSPGGTGRQLGGSRPVVISSGNGLRATERAMELLRRGEDTLEAVVDGVGIVEGDPEDQSVGFGGLPNEEGVVELDSSVMHGPSRGGGAVAAIRDIKHPARVAKQVMENTDHVLLVGEGATRFALAMGHERVNLLTGAARERWLRWKRSLSERDDWIDPIERIPHHLRPPEPEAEREHGTINCCAVDQAGDISGVTTTSGLAFKIPGRVGDSPILGAGLYVDNDVGACGSTGRGEANLKTCASFLGVELMRQGLGPEEAGLQALRRIVDHTVEPYLLDDQGRPRFQVSFYLVDKSGRFAGVSMWSGSKFAAHDGKRNRLYETAYLFERPPKDAE